MKNLLSKIGTFAFLFSALFCAACSSDSDPDAVTVGVPSVNFSTDGGTQSIPIQSNTTWTVSGAQSWLTVSPMQGSNNGSIMINASVNNERSSRSCILYINAGSASTSVMVSQAGKTIDDTVEGNYVGTLKPMGYVDTPAPCYVSVTKLSNSTYRLTSLICETFSINLNSGYNLVAQSSSDGRVSLTSETTYSIEGSYFQGTLTLSFSIGSDNFFFSGVKN